MKPRIRRLSHGAIIAALYVLFTLLSSLLGLSGGVLQLRLSESLCVLAALSGAAVPGLFVGCLLANLLTGAVLWDTVFGSLATLLAAILSRALARRNPYLALLPPILVNTAVIPLILRYAYGLNDAYMLIVLSIFISETLSAGVLGALLFPILRRMPIFRK